MRRYQRLSLGDLISVYIRDPDYDLVESSRLLVGCEVGCSRETSIRQLSDRRRQGDGCVDCGDARRAHCLDAPATRYLQASPLCGPNGDPNRVTVRMLGAHNSGLPATFAAYVTDGAAARTVDAELSPAAYLANYGRLAHPPGEIYEYGNLGFEALGAIMSDVTGEALGTAMERRLLVTMRGTEGSRAM